MIVIPRSFLILFITTDYAKTITGLNLRDFYLVCFNYMLNFDSLKYWFVISNSLRFYVNLYSYRVWSTTLLLKNLYDVIKCKILNYQVIFNV